MTEEQEHMSQRGLSFHEDALPDEQLLLDGNRRED